MTDTDYLKDKNFAPDNLGEVCVLGLGKTGFSVAKYLCDLLTNRVESVHVYAGEKLDFAMHNADKILKMGASVSFDDKEIVHKYDLCIASPGISVNSELIKTAKENCTEVISEIEFAWRESSKDCKWIAITGTNGKTTATSLITHILNESKKKAISVGNIGNVAIDAVGSNTKKSMYEHTSIYVVEVSSYQLALCKNFAPDVACLINITPDHIEWHGSFEEYKKAKLKIFNNAKLGIVNCDDAEIVNNLNFIKSKVIALIKTYHDDEFISVDFDNAQHKILPINEMKIIGEHNCINARISTAACLALDLNDEQIADGIKSFCPLEHRLEPCGIVAGIRLFNDSKSTNVDSTLVAIKSFEHKKAIFMLGGKDKNTPLDSLVNACFQNLKGVVIYGEAKERFLEAFNNYYKDENFILEQAENMGSAFKIAMENAYPGDFVVLSPACSSFDEFKNFEERGEVFKKLVEKCK